jgi:hypothetical protein
MWKYPTESELREIMQRRVAVFSRIAKVPRTTVCKNALGNASFMAAIGNGSNFRIGSYMRLMDWLDANEPSYEDYRRETMLIVATYCADARITMEELGKRALGDERFVSRLVGHEEIETMEFVRLLEWIDQHEPELTPEERHLVPTDVVPHSARV